VEAQAAKTRTSPSWAGREAKEFSVAEALAEVLLEKIKTPAPDFTRALELVKLALASDVSTPHDGAVFWSGGKDVAGVAAGKFADKRSAGGQKSRRLEMTPGGSELGDTVTAGGDTWEQQFPSWLAISKRFAQQASGEVNMIISYMPLSQTAIFREEAKVLAANKKVTQINVWLMKKDANGEYIKAPDGTYELEKVSMADVLKPPPKKS
jgi:type VI secretion system secreted protein VgrG